MSRSLVAALLLCALGCNGKPAPAPATMPAPAPEPDAEAATACARDIECTGGWHPQMPTCGPTDRCVEGACAPPPALTGEATTETGRLVFEGAAGEVTYQVEVQDDDFEIQRGMMCRRSMRPGWGMLFLMPQTRAQRFWMKNTLIPLDMVFLDEDWKVVGVVAEAAPQTLTGRSVDAPSRYVLELVGGAAAKAGVQAGVQARFYPPAAADR
jgi:uncharacterized membrane protein (UPF0127 family)